MKKDLHPPYHEITVITTSGEKRVMHSTMGKPGDVLRLDIDHLSHPAWTGQKRFVQKGGRMDRFKDRYGDLGKL
ncbi:50S ribosomal protein L31 [bacterium NHP-B]|nr:50S ribosomal protein L31 [bacterium NHP-B]